MTNPVRALKDEAVAARRRPDLPGWFAPAGAVAASILAVVAAVSLFFGSERSEEPELPELVAPVQPTGEADAVGTDGALIHDFDDPNVYRVAYTGPHEEDHLYLTDFEVYALATAASGVYNGEAGDLPSVGNNPPPIVPGDWQPQVHDVVVTNVVTDTANDDRWQQFSADVFVVPDGSDDPSNATPVQITLVWDDSIDFWAVSW